MPWPRGILAAMLCAAVAAAQDPSVLRERSRAVLAREHCQTVLPENAREAGLSNDNARQAGTGIDANDPKVHRRPTANDHGIPAETGPRLGPDSPGFRAGDMGQIAQAFVWLVGVVVLALVAFAIVRAIAERRAERRPAAAAATARAPDGTPLPAVPDHARLAAEGRFAEAVHALLLQAFVAMAERRGRTWPRALTGREILAGLGGLQQGDAPLQAILTTSERGWFGGRELVRDHYDACVRAWHLWSRA